MMLFSIFQLLEIGGCSPKFGIAFIQSLNYGPGRACYLNFLNSPFYMLLWWWRVSWRILVAFFGLRSFENRLASSSWSRNLIFCSIEWLNRPTIVKCWNCRLILDFLSQFLSLSFIWHTVSTVSLPLRLILGRIFEILSKACFLWASWHCFDF
jgi:hypothetical protein